MRLFKKLAVLATTTITLSLSLLGNVNAQDWKSAYRDQIKYMTDNASAYNSDYGLTYTVNDIDKDGIKELIVRTGGCEADYQYMFYTYSNGQVVSLGSKVAGWSALYGLNGNGIYLYKARQGYETLYKLTKYGNQLYTNVIYESRFAPYDNYNIPQNHITEIKTTDYSYLPY
jgi:hypothetical protein